MRKIMITILLSAGLYGCENRQEKMATVSNAPAIKLDSTQMETEKSKIVIRMANPEEIGSPATCPVMGTKFTVNAATEATDYNGNTYFFCCSGCPEQFKNDPIKYVPHQKENE